MAFMHPSAQSADKAQALARDFKNVVADAEELLQALGNDGDAKVKAMKSRVQASLNQARERLGDMQSSVVDSAKAAANATDEYVHHNPWQAIGVVAVFGALVGYLIGRR
ncbi:MAG TPA: DUF883 family protein [Burkholderiaceae bacterium]|nr:DUF883 family protein [Burkholderiaceae bacterium]